MPQTFDVILFTDGACSGNPGPGGWGCLLRHVKTGKEKRLSGGEPATTNNRMELRAVIEGLTALTAAPLRVQVVTDSQYVSRGMTEWLPGWLRNNWRRGPRGKSEVKNVDLWKQLAALCNKHQVAFVHIRGHAGHPENEECDRLAVAAAAQHKNQCGRMKD